MSRDISPGPPETSTDFLMPESIPEAPPSPEVALALDILRVFQKHARLSGIDPLQSADGPDLPTGRPLSIAVKAAEELLLWARDHAPEEPC